MKIRKSAFAILMIIMLAVGGLLGFAVTSLGAVGVGSKVSISKKDYKDLKYMKEKYGKLEAIWNETDSTFYKAVDDDKLETAMYKGLIGGLGDEYSEYMTKEEYDQWKSAVMGVYEGVGITFGQNDDGDMTVLRVNADSPAEKAGIKEGDIMLEVDGKEYTDTDKMSAAIRGEAGTKVTVKIKRGDKTMEKTMTRAEISNETVTTEQLDDKIGYIWIGGFEEATAEDFKKALAECEEKDRALIIDLRDNGGGLVDSAVEITDALMGKGVITYLEDQHGKKEYYRSKKGATKLPYAVLVNENTASAAEIMTAAIQDNTDHPIVGTTTYGKGIVQDTRALSDGSALKLTVMQYFSPDGHVIHEKGITPDEEVKGDDAQLEKAIQLMGG